MLGPQDSRRLTLAELAEGDWIAFDVVLSEEIVLAFAGLTGDHSPIHVDPQYARTIGLPGCVVHGMLAASFLSTIVGMFLPGRRSLLVSQKVDFVAPIPVGVTVSVSARLVQVSEAARAVTLQFRVFHGGLVAVKGSATVRVREIDPC